MNKETLGNIYNKVIIKSKLYHFVCYGGGSGMLVNAYSEYPKYICYMQGRNELPCKNCAGLIQTNFSLTEDQINYNRGVEALYEAIKKATK